MEKDLDMTGLTCSLWLLWLKTDCNLDKIVWYLNQDGSREGCEQWTASGYKKPQEVSQRAATRLQQHSQIFEGEGTADVVDPD